MNSSSPGGGTSSLADIPFLSSLSPDERAEIERHCQFQEYGPNEKVIQQGDDFRDVFYLLSGQAYVLNYSENGRAVSYATFGEGEFFGELAAIDGLPRSAWVWTMSPCTVLVMPGSVFRNMVTADAELSLALLQKLAGIIRTSDERIAEFGLLGAEQRMCIELIRTCEPDPASPRNLIVSPVPTQVHYANVIGASRETVSRVFGRLREKGIVRREGKTLHIVDRDRLEQGALI